MDELDLLVCIASADKPYVLSVRERIHAHRNGLESTFTPTEDNLLVKFGVWSKAIYRRGFGWRELHHNWQERLEQYEDYLYKNG